MDFSNLEVSSIYWLSDIMINDWLFVPIAYLELDFSSRYNTIFKSLELCKN